jgi:hypothetical protein
MELAALSGKARSFLLRGTEGDFEAVRQASPPTFSPFFLADAIRAAEVSAEFMRAFHTVSSTEEGLEAVLSHASEVAEAGDIELARFALLAFVTHEPRARVLNVPSLFERRPEVLAGAIDLAQTKGAGVTELEAATGDEAFLDWYRQDPFANEHHEHWHLVYLTQGVPRPDGTTARQDRQGELFFYMHRQMLARYDAERIGVGLPPIVAFQQLDAAIPEGYEPELENVLDFPGDQQARIPYEPRTAGRTLGSIPDGAGGVIDAAVLAAWRDHVANAVDEGLFDGALGADLLGSTIEPSIGALNIGAPPGMNVHGMGHVLAAFAMGEQLIDNGQVRRWRGVMIDIHSAIRDPFFYRWHKHIDDQLSRLQQRFQPRTTTDLALDTSVSIRGGGLQGGRSESPDIILVFPEDQPDLDVEDQPAAQQWAAERFGEQHWDEEFFDGDVATATLQTQFEEGVFVPTEGGAPVTVRYLHHKPFAYCIRLENGTLTPTRVTIRVFLAPESTANDRRAWIEMDTFEADLDAGHNVVFHEGRRSSVVKKNDQGIATRPPILNTVPGRGDPTPDESYCDCGWPYNLMLPRGTSAGMGFRLAVMITRNDIDMQGFQAQCGSVSLCGALRRRYPDTRPMGYPFDHDMDRPIEEMIQALPNMAARTIRVKHR